VRRVARINIESANCTAPAYYAGEAPPTDNQDPSSTPFLTIEPGAEFLFAIAGPSPLREKVLHLLKDAVMCLGVGARTGLGYGRFEEPRERPARPSEPAEATPAEPT